MAEIEAPVAVKTEAEAEAVAAKAVVERTAAEAAEATAVTATEEATAEAVAKGSDTLHRQVLSAVALRFRALRQLNVAIESAALPMLVDAVPLISELSLPIVENDTDYYDRHPAVAPVPWPQCHARRL